mmetsp:Transcript_101833/g.323594  ORF Transcript_101833/g.323594 Transcript_101833/m.323594 type:complete len:270 (+) Transcript_101833:345-1154(+)
MHAGEAKSAKSCLLSWCTLSGTPCTAPRGEGTTSQPQARPRAWCPRQIPNSGMARAPSNARRARDIVRGETSGLPGPGPSNTCVGRTLTSTSSAEGAFARPSTITTSAPRTAQALTIFRLKESRLSTKSTRQARCLEAPGEVGGKGASPRDQRRHARQPPPTPCSLLPRASASAASRPSTRASTGSTGCCARSPQEPASAAPPPKAAFSNRSALDLASSTSASGSEPMVRPPPALMDADHLPSSGAALSQASSVRIRMFHWESPLRRST